MGVRIHTHLCETKDEEDFCLDVVGRRPLQYMADCGWISSDVWFAHGIYFNDEELKLLADTQTGIAHCPVSNMKLASGVCRVPEMLDLGIPVGLAVDGSASNDCSNLMAEIRAAYLLHRLTYSTNAPTGYDLLKMATKGSASVLGRHDIGSIEVGKAGDIFMIDVEQLECVDRSGSSVFLGTVGYSRPAEYVLVQGKIVVDHGTILGIDEEKGTYKGRCCSEEYVEKGDRPMIQKLNMLSWDKVKALRDKDPFYVLPISALEQHGCHLPLGTDDIILEKVIENVLENGKFQAELLLLPTVHYGNSAEHMDFPGTVSLDCSTIIKIVENLMTCMNHQGYNRLIIVNSHGGILRCSRLYPRSGNISFI